MHETLPILINLVSQTLGLRADELDENTAVSALKLDSLDMLELVMAIEEAFSIELDPAEMEQCQSLAEVADLIAAHTG